MFGAGMSSSVHIGQKNQDILILGEGPTQVLDDTTLTAEGNYPISFTQPRKRFVLSLHYNRSNSFLFVNATKIYQFKTKDSEVKYYTLCLGNSSKNFTINNMKKTKRNCKFFPVDFNPVYSNDILDIHKYLMKRKQHEIMLNTILKMVIVLLSNTVNESNLTNCHWAIRNICYPTVKNFTSIHFWLNQIIKSINKAYIMRM